MRTWRPSVPQTPQRSVQEMGLLVDATPPDSGPGGTSDSIPPSLNLSSLTPFRG